MADLSSSNIANLQLLSDMLKPPGNDFSDDDDMPESGAASYNPGSIGPKQTSKDTSKQSIYAKKDTKDIWDDEEVPSSTMFEEDGDDRPQPEYDISYKQKVTSEDMFLGTTGKNPSSACCENLIIKISLPNTKMSEVDLQVKEHVLDCRSPKFKLVLPMPHPVDPESGSAKWDPKDSKLVVTLLMKREYDFINFQS